MANIFGGDKTVLIFSKCICQTKGFGPYVTINTLLY